MCYPINPFHNPINLPLHPQVNYYTTIPFHLTKDQPRSDQYTNVQIIQPNPLFYFISLFLTAIPCGMDFGFTFKWIKYGNNYFKEVAVVTN
jgi:hypothetical protein